MQLIPTALTLSILLLLPITGDIEASQSKVLIHPAPHHPTDFKNFFGQLKGRILILIHGSVAPQKTPEGIDHIIPFKGYRHFKQYAKMMNTELLKHEKQLLKDHSSEDRKSLAKHLILGFSNDSLQEENLANLFWSTLAVVNFSEIIRLDNSQDDWELLVDIMNGKRKP